MKKFTKGLMTLALLCVAVVSAKAETVNADLSKYGDKWDETDVSFSWTATYGNQLTPNLTEIGLPKGDLTSWEKLVVEVDELNNCDFFRILVYSGSDTNHSNTFKATTTGKIEFSLSGNVDYLDNVTKICLSGSNWEDSKSSTWSTTPASFKVKSVYLERPDDPLSLPKDNLSKAITLGKKQDSFAKTDASWTVLTTAITNGEAELVNASATAESLISAKAAIESAIAGFKYEAGYAKLTKEMANQGVNYVLNESTDLPYGNGNVNMNIFADLSAYDKLIVIASEGKPRFCMNRQTTDGQIAQTKDASEMIDINTQGDYAEYTWATEAYQTVEENKYTVDLQKIAADWDGEAKLHCIKGWNYSNVTVTDMLVYAEKTKLAVGAKGYATFSGIMDVDMTGVTAYAAKVNGDKVELTEVTKVPAGAAVIVKAAADTYSLTNIVGAAAIENNDLLVSDGTVAGDGTIYVLFDGAKGVGFYKLANDVKVPAGKAYLKIAAAGREFIGFGVEATGIAAAKSEQADGAVYNLAGQRVAKAQKGLYIIGGKKLMVK